MSTEDDQRARVAAGRKPPRARSRGLRTIPRIDAIYARRRVLWTLVVRDLRVRYAGSILGYVWTILDPLLMAGVYFVVFTLIFKTHRVGGHPYFLFLLVGLLSWQWYSGAITDTSRALLQEAKLVRSTNLPRELWVVRIVIAKGIEFILSLPVLLVFVVVYVIKGDTHVRWQLVMFPAAVVLQFVLLTGIGLILAPITTLITDTQRVIRIGLRLLFYMTPVLYGVAAVPKSLRIIVDLNPMTGILELYRAGLFTGQVNRDSVIVGVVTTAIVFLIGTAVFTKLERAVLKEI